MWGKIELVRYSAHKNTCKTSFYSKFLGHHHDITYLANFDAFKR